MKQMLRRGFLLLLLLIICVGCSGSPDSRILIFKLDETTLKKDVNQLILELKDEEGIEHFTNLLKHSSQESGIFDITPPPYVVEVSLAQTDDSSKVKNGTLLLHLSRDGAMYCYEEDTHTWYSIK